MYIFAIHLYRYMWQSEYRYLASKRKRATKRALFSTNRFNPSIQRRRQTTESSGTLPDQTIPGE